LIGTVLHVSDVFDKIKTEFVKEIKQTKGQRQHSEIEATLQQGDYSSEQSAAPLANSGRSRCQTAKSLVGYASRTFKVRE